MLTLIKLLHTAWNYFTPLQTMVNYLLNILQIKKFFSFIWHRSSKKNSTLTKVINNRLTFNFYDYKPSSKIKSLIKRVENFQKDLNTYYVNTKDDLRSAIHKQLKLQWTYHSNAIEGSTLTLGDTIFFLENGLTVSGKPFKDFLDAKNHVEAIDYLYDIISNQRELSAYLMKEINAILLSGVTTAPAVDPQGRPTTKLITPGAYKMQPNHVIQLDGTIHYYVDPAQVASEMDNLFAWINRSINVQSSILTATIAHYNLVRIHPFDDGNGRGGRILMNLILMRERYSPAIIKVENRRTYIEALNQADNGNIESFIGIVCNALIETQELIISEIKQFTS